MIVITDASLYGVGAQLCNIGIKGQLKYVSCASATLSAAVKIYCQYERVSLALIFALRKYHKYLYSKHFS